MSPLLPSKRASARDARYRHPAFFHLAIFLVALAAAAALIADHSRDTFDLRFTRDAASLTEVISGQARVTTDNLAHAVAFVSATEPTRAEWRDFIDRAQLARSSWVEAAVVIREVDRGGLSAFGAEERRRGWSGFRAYRLGEQDRIAVITRVTPNTPDRLIGLNVYSFPGVEGLLEEAENTGRGGLGPYPTQSITILQRLAAGLGAENWLGSMAAAIPIQDSGSRGWLVAQLGFGDDLERLAARGRLGFSITVDSATRVHRGVVLRTGAERSGVEIRTISTDLAELEVRVWPLGAPAFGARELFSAAAIAALVSLLAWLGLRFWAVSARLQSSHRELRVDLLTGLANRAGIEAALAQAIDRAGESRRHLAVLVLDVDRFKVVNDSLGHAVGDALLRVVGARLREGVGAEATVGRFGGDEFVVISPDLDGPDAALALAHRLAGSLAEPVEMDERILSVSASIGVASAPPGAAPGPEELLRDADAAMYAAKRTGRSVCVFGSSLRRQALERMAVEQALVAALEGEGAGLFLEYQPIVAVDTGEMVGVEALARLRSAGLGRIEPGRFVPVAREVGLLGRLDAQVLRLACADAARWNARNPDRAPLRVSLNVSEAQAADAGFAARVRDETTRAGITPGQLMFEVSEDALVEHLRECVPVLRRVARMGAGLSVDDFGTGRSSLAHLRLLSFVTEVKIDRSFVAGLPDNRTDREIVAAIAELASALDADVVAEGVQRRSQILELRRLGIARVQGFVVARPLPARVVGDLLAGGALVADPVEEPLLPLP